MVALSDRFYVNILHKLSVRVPRVLSSPTCADLGEIHVPQDSHHDDEFGVIGISTLLVSRRPQNRQNVAKTKVVVDLKDGGK